LPERAGPAITTREPLPNGVSHSIAFTVGSLEPSRIRSDGQATGRSSKRVPSADLVGRLAVDRVDADERREALGAPRPAQRARHAVARHELAALDLRGRDVDVVVALLGRREAQEAGAVGQQLDDALDGALATAATAVGGRRRLIGHGRPLAVLVAPAGTAATAAPAAPAATRLVVVAALLRALLGLGLGDRGDRGDGLIGLPGDDRVDQLGLAQAAEAVDAELVGEQVQIGEWALLQSGAVQD
jgi:hypothetical protein